MTEEIKEEGRRVSYTQYSMWSNCPRQWKLSYVDKLKPQDKSIHLIFGTAVHFAIQEWLEVYYNSNNKVTKKHFDIKDVFKTELFRLFEEDTIINESGEKVYVCDKATLKEFYIDGTAILDHVIQHKKEFFPPNAKLIGCEIPLDVPLRDKLKFIGYIDLVIEKPDGTICLYDFKTSKAGWYFEKKDPKKVNQLLLYKSFYSKVFGVDQDMIEVQFLILKRKINEDTQWAQNRLSRFDPPQAKLSVKKATDSFDEFVNTTFAEDGTVLVENLVAKSSKNACRFCPFKSTTHCPEGYTEY